MEKKYSDVALGRKARKKLLKGTQLASDVVGTTLGPRGRNIVIHKYHDTEVLHDGVRVLNTITPKDPFVDAGVSLIKQAARNQVDQVGDGTTVVTLLTHAIISEAMSIVESGVNAMSLRSALIKGKEKLVQQIEKQARQLKTLEDYINVATISAEDEHMGKIIGETFFKVKLDGVVTVNDQFDTETYVEHQDGTRLNAGWIHPLFVTNPRTGTATVENTHVLVTDYTLDNIYELAEPIKRIVEQAKITRLLIICGDMKGNVLASFIQNKKMGSVQSVAVKAPTHKQSDTLIDITTMTGAQFISKDANQNLKDIGPEHLGFAKSVTVSKDTTVILGGGGDKQAVEDRISFIKDQIKEETNAFDKEKLKERLARMTGGVYVVNVGGHTEVEARERKERAIDAVEATKSAIKGGVVPGGETVYLAIDDCLKAQNEYEDYAYRILKKALETPFKRLLGNAGLDAGAYSERLKNKKLGMGVNVETGEVVDLNQTGILDPALVSISALNNAVSVAVNVITSDGIVDEIIEKI